LGPSARSCRAELHAGAALTPPQTKSVRTDRRFDELRDDLNARFSELSTQIAEHGGRIGRLQHAILIGGGGIFASFIAVLAAIIGLIATQL
jgi:hypothetical protein